MIKQKLKVLDRSNDYTEVEETVRRLEINPTLKATIIIPFYKGSEYLAKTLNSLINQSYPLDLYEVIIVQDVGGEDIDEMIRKLKKMMNIELIKVPHIGFTPARSRNIGLENASHEIIISIDFDIICPKRFIESHMKWYHVSNSIAAFGLRKFIDCAYVLAPDVVKNIKSIENLPSIKSKSNTAINSLLDKRLPEVKSIKEHPFPYNCYHGCNISYPRRVAFNIGKWDEEFNGNYGYEDIEFGYRLWKAGLYLVYIPEALVLHQENDAVSIKEKQKGMEINRVLLYKKVQEIKHFRDSKLEDGIVCQIK